MSLTAQQAAEALGVSRMQISRLVKQGDLRASRVGNALLIDPVSVSAYRDLRPERGRPLAPRSAWQRITEAMDRITVDGRDAGDIARHLAVVARRRAEERPCRVLPNRLTDLFADDRVVISGADAGQRHGAPVRPGEPHSIYVSRSHASDVAKDYRLRDAGADDPNVLVRIVEPREWILDHRVAPPLVAAIDAIDDGDARSAAEILRLATTSRPLR